MAKGIDYDKLSEIDVKSQEELDAIPESFAGRIYIEFGTYFNKAIVRKRYGSTVVAWENSTVEAWENSTVEAWENSTVEAWENSTVEARGNTQIVDVYGTAKIEITGNARIVYNPKTIRGYCDFYGIEYGKKKGRFFKAVHKIDGRYFSDNDYDYEYVIGSKQKPDSFDTDVSKDCGHGLHIAYLAWVLDYGKDWSDLAILEVEAVLDDVVVPNGMPGKVRAPELTVLREVPLEECGVYGKILAKRRKEASDYA